MLCSKTERIVEEHNHEKSLLYLIDTGIKDGNFIIYKYGRTTDLKRRMEQHVRTFRHMTLLHVEPVFDSINCEKKMTTSLAEFHIPNSCFKQRELLQAHGHHYFIKVMGNISRAEKATLRAKLQRQQEPLECHQELKPSPYFQDNKIVRFQIRT
jgi:hypothetical protein